MDNYSLIRTFTKIEEVQELVSILDDASIKYEIQKIDVNLIPYLQFSSETKYGLFISHEDLQSFEKLFEKSINKYNIEDHPLQKYSDEDLMEVLEKQDEWSSEEILVAKRLLGKRGKIITDKDLLDFRKQRIDELKKPIKGKKMNIIAGFLVPALAIAFIGKIGIISLILYLLSYGIGLNYLLDYKKLPNGEKVKSYDQQTRKTGLYIILWTVLLTIAAVFYTIYYD